MICIGKITQFSKQKSYPLTINNKHLLLIHQDGHFFLIKNQCGHFGIPLDDARIKNKHIICAQHGISFNLKTGLIVNRPFENCSPITVYPLQQLNNKLYYSEDT